MESSFQRQQGLKKNSSLVVFNRIVCCETNCTLFLLVTKTLLFCEISQLLYYQNYGITWLLFVDLFLHSQQLRTAKPVPTPSGRQWGRHDPHMVDNMVHYTEMTLW